MEKLNYTVVVWANLTVEQIEKNISDEMAKHVKQYEGHVPEPLTRLIFMFLGHGGNHNGVEFVLDAQGEGNEQEMKVLDIVKAFTFNDTQSIPRLFFFCCCRGSKACEVFKPGESKEGLGGLVVPVNADCKTLCFIAAEDGIPEDSVLVQGNKADAKTFTSNQIPGDKNFTVTFADKLCDQIEWNHTRYNFEQIMTKTADEMIKFNNWRYEKDREAKLSTVRSVECPEVRNRFTKNFMF